MQQGLAAHPQGTGCACGSEQWMVILVISPAYSSPFSLSKSPGADLQFQLSFNRFAAAWGALGQPSALTAPLCSSPHVQTYLSQLWKAPGIASKFYFFSFLPSSFRHTFQCFLSLLAELRVDGGCILCTWVRLSLLPLLAIKSPLLSLVSWPRERVLTTSHTHRALCSTFKYSLNI